MPLPREKAQQLAGLSNLIAVVGPKTEGGDHRTHFRLAVRARPMINDWAGSRKRVNLRIDDSTTVRWNSPVKTAGFGRNVIN